MNKARLLVMVCLLTMSGALTWGFIAGDFWREGAILLDLPWGVISVIDVYTGGALFAGWIACREQSWPRTLAWAVLILFLGNLATSLYALLALSTCAGSWERFWMGRPSAPR